ncbi:MAG: hypothetical protein IPJ03_01130 [Ignavibacteriales bacterium]|nr:hypothetical protein [Ignavibacteriales bacterium]
MGFSTIIDILGSMIIGGLLMLTLTRLSDNTVDSEVTWGHDRLVQQEVSNLATTIESDFRKMGYSASEDVLDDTTTFIFTADTSQIIFRADFDSDGELDRMNYYLSSTNELSETPNERDRILYRKLNDEQPMIVSTGVTDFYLNYFDTFNAELSQPIADNRMIESLRISFRIEDPDAYSQYNEDTGEFEQKYSHAMWSQLRLTSRNLRKR